MAFFQQSTDFLIHGLLQLNRDSSPFLLCYFRPGFEIYPNLVNFYLAFPFEKFWKFFRQFSIFNCLVSGLSSRSNLLHLLPTHFLGPVFIEEWITTLHQWSTSFRFLQWGFCHSLCNCNSLEVRKTHIPVNWGVFHWCPRIVRFRSSGVLVISNSSLFVLFHPVQRWLLGSRCLLWFWIYCHL